ncbi:MAG: phosphoglucosamine mutase [Candidatus Binatia bacterium]
MNAGVVDSAAGRRERKLFGTDGIRGVANIEPMTPEAILRLGRAVGRYFQTSGDRRHKIVIGKDTRLSGYMIETALASGLCSMGVDPLLVGPMPTPGISFLTRSLRADAGVAISASHNPFEDNGIKFFGPDGFKLADEAELAIEALVFGEEIDRVRPTAGGIGKAYRIDDAAGRYNVFLKHVVPKQLTFDGLRIVVDCSNGAAYRIAPEVLRELGAEVVTIGNTPDGLNINEGCGALHTDLLAERVVREGAHLGLALDGDADRAILVDELGEQVDGDHILGILALALEEQGELSSSTVVTTVMSNLGLEVSLKEKGISMLRTPVGDRYVVERMLAGGLNLGGEQSGHIVCLDHTTTGDGMITALLVITRLVEMDQPLSALKEIFTKFPQTLINLRVKHKPDFMTVDSIAGSIRTGEQMLGGRGRVLVRYSGTEPVARVMVEGEDPGTVEDVARKIAGAIEAALA